MGYNWATKLKLSKMKNECENRVKNKLIFNALNLLNQYDNWEKTDKTLKRVIDACSTQRQWAEMKKDDLLIGKLDKEDIFIFSLAIDSLNSQLAQLGILMEASRILNWKCVNAKTMCDARQEYDNSFNLVKEFKKYHEPFTSFIIDYIKSGSPEDVGNDLAELKSYIKTLYRIGVDAEEKQYQELNSELSKLIKREKNRETGLSLD